MTVCVSLFLLLLMDSFSLFSNILSFPLIFPSFRLFCYCFLSVSLNNSLCIFISSAVLWAVFSCFTINWVFPLIFPSFRLFCYCFLSVFTFDGLCIFISIAAYGSCFLFSNILGFPVARRLFHLLLPKLSTFCVPTPNQTCRGR